MSVATIANWAANLAVAASVFSLLNAISKAGTSSAGWAERTGGRLLLQQVPETEGLSLEAVGWTMA